MMSSYEENKTLLNSILDLLSAHFGSDVEFVIHDLSLDYEHTIVDIRNGEVTGRKEGDTGDILGLEVIRNAAKKIRPITIASVTLPRAKPSNHRRCFW